MDIGGLANAWIGANTQRGVITADNPAWNLQFSYDNSPTPEVMSGDTYVQVKTPNFHMPASRSEESIQEELKLKEAERAVASAISAAFTPEEIPKLLAALASYKSISSSLEYYYSRTNIEFAYIQQVAEETLQRTMKYDDQEV